jgi:phenylacetate-CoA ligase
MEVSGLGWQTAACIGLHLNSEGHLLEVLRNGEAVGPQEEGEFVVTSFVNDAMPFIRYRTGDIGMLLDGPCPCGRTLPLFTVTQGRVVEDLHFANGRRVLPYTIMAVLQDIPHILRFQAVQTSKDRLEVRIEVNKWNANLTSDLRAKLAAVVGEDTTIELHVGSDSWAPAAGKVQPVVGYR